MTKITPNYIAEAAIPKHKSKEIRDLAVTCLAIAIECYKDVCVERAVIDHDDDCILNQFDCDCSKSLNNETRH